MTLRPRGGGHQPCSTHGSLVPFVSPAEAQRRPYYADYSPARRYIHSLCTSHYLDLFITFIIGVNVITMSMEHYNQPKVGAAPQHGSLGVKSATGPFSVLGKPWVLIQLCCLGVTCLRQNIDFPALGKNPS